MIARTDLETLLDCQIIMIDSDPPDDISGNIAAEIRLFYGDSNFAGKTILCIIHNPDLTGIEYTIPSDALCNAAYNEMSLILAKMDNGKGGLGITWGPFTDPKTIDVEIEGEVVTTNYVRIWKVALILDAGLIDGN